MPGIVWIAVIGLLAGIIARFLLPGPNNPQGFLVTMVIGIVGAFVATFIGQSIGWYRHDQGAGLIGATLGSIIVLFIWHRLVVQRTVNDPGVTSMAHLNTLFIVSQMLRIPAPAAPTTFGTCEAFTVASVISLNSFMCASVAGPAIPSATSPFFC